LWHHRHNCLHDPNRSTWRRWNSPMEKKIRVHPANSSEGISPPNPCATYRSVGTDHFRGATIECRTQRDTPIDRCPMRSDSTHARKTTNVSNDVDRTANSCRASGRQTARSVTNDRRSPPLLAAVVVVVEVVVTAG
jgi:hypothetical protein